MVFPIAQVALLFNVLNMINLTISKKNVDVVLLEQSNIALVIVMVYVIAKLDMLVINVINVQQDITVKMERLVKVIF